jgi:hypothetical protein
VNHAGDGAINSRPVKAWRKRRRSQLLLAPRLPNGISHDHIEDHIEIDAHHQGCSSQRLRADMVYNLIEFGSNWWISALRYAWQLQLR